MKRIYSVMAICAALGTARCGSSQEELSDAHDMYNAAKNPGVIEPQNAEERQVLESIETLKEGQSETVGVVTVAIVRTYHAASGRVCKAVAIAPRAAPGTSEHRLVCRMNDGWFFMPEVTEVSN